MNTSKTSERAIWLEPIHLHFHHGDSIEVKLAWGHAMKSMRAGEPKNLKAVVINPSGQESAAKIIRDNENLYFRLVAESGPEGIYTVQAENYGLHSNQERNCQWAQMLVPVGHHVHGTGRAANRGMEIVPGEYHDFHPGDEIELTVMLDGKPVPGVQVQATYHLYEGEGFLHNFSTDEKGKARFTFDARGHWLFQVCKKENNTSNTATLVIPGVR
ncbi:DUF4198 domain-containing protein [Desulfotruncus alcoholivorax]|uniref:DUF4198 domain-containing protein n=1 Tax=Desulfotruncus alcoholivorax TaxID=265477 RepID=UPI00048374EB|nr:DUF4198 domain-containing protein [Desulfotruncus alcoholivorax]